jgi:signal transduction histidine kinase
MPAVAVNFETVQGREKLAKSLESAQTMTEELESQQEELKTVNEELEEQTQALEASEQKLKVQQEELETANEELMEKNESLEQQKQEIEKTRKAIEIKAEELSVSGRYKSEFLANMSHELRTPLNSLLLLSSILGENKEKNLTPDQLESIGVIYQSGNDLLSLINEILDLSKIESGKMELQVEELKIQDIADTITSNFQHLVDNKGLNLAIRVSDNVPPVIHTDRKRLDQVIKNLMSNAIKFTEKGGVTVDFTRPPEQAGLSESGIDGKHEIAIVVKDTGIGISARDQKIVFEAFQQVEGGTARQYGGTGLGLSISRELTRLLGGEIRLSSEKGKGSAFTICLPVNPPMTDPAARQQEVSSPRAIETNRHPEKTAHKNTPAERIPDDRDTIKKDEKIIQKTLNRKR